MSEECFKNNLFLLKKIKSSDILAFSDNKLFLDNRYFTYIRSSYDFNTIINIIEKTLSNKEDIELVKESLEGLNTLAKNDSYSEDEKLKILNLYNKINKDLSEHLSEDLSKESSDNEEDIIDENISNQKTNEYLNYIKDTFIETWYNLRLFFKDTFVFIYGLVKN